jgi:hypothetical protein
VSSKSLKPDKRRATIDFDAEVYERVVAIGKTEERDFSTQIRYIVKQWLETQPKKLRP